MLTRNFAPTLYNSKHDIASYNLSKQSRRRKKHILNLVEKDAKWEKRNDKSNNIKSKKRCKEHYITMLKYDKRHYDSLCYDTNTTHETKTPKRTIAPYRDFKPSRPKRSRIKNKVAPIQIDASRGLLITGYCNSLKQAEGISNAVLVQIINLYLNTSSSSDSHQTQRAIASANFIGDVIQTFQDRHKCRFVENDGDHIDLLQFVYVRGGALRDVLLSRDINDIDLIIDTNGLTKVYLEHLMRYHSDQSCNRQSIDCNCYLWQRYLNLFRMTADKYHKNTERDEIKRFEKHVVSSEFLLNARFFKDIIVNSAYNHDDDVIHTVNTWGYTNWKLTVQKTLLYKWIDLNGANFDIGDEMSNSNGLRHAHALHLQFNSSWNTVFDCIQRHCRDGTMNRMYGQYGRDRMDVLIAIQLPLYTFDMKYSTQYCDFTVNGLRLPLSAITDDIFNTNHWYSKLFSYVNDHNEMAIYDIGLKLIRQPDLSELRMDEIYDGYFWRLVKILTKLDWKVDDCTLRLIHGSFVRHFADLNEEKMKEFINRLLFWTIPDTLSANEFAKIIKTRFDIFEMIEVSTILKKALRKPQFESLLNDTIQNDRKINAQKKALLRDMLYEYDLKPKTSKAATTKNGKGQKKRKATSSAPSLMTAFATSLGASIKPLVKTFTKKKMYKHYKFHDDDNIYKGNYYFNEDNMRLSWMVKRKWGNNHNKCTPKQMKRKKKLKKSKKSKQRAHLNLFLKKAVF